jgi:hypothetical protein
MLLTKIQIQKASFYGFSGLFSRLLILPVESKLFAHQIQ